MAEYDIDGWTVPDLINPDDINLVMKKRKPNTINHESFDGEEIRNYRKRAHFRHHRFRSALGRFASGVTVVTAQHDEHPRTA